MKQAFVLFLVLLFVSSYAIESSSDFLSLYDQETAVAAPPAWKNPTYDPSLALHYLYAAETVVCQADIVATWTCGTNCNNLPGFFMYYYLDEVVQADNHSIPIAYDIIINNQTKEVIFGFRGTSTRDQLKDEFTHFIALSYSTPDFIVPGATVDRYFGLVYLNFMRADVISKLQALVILYPDYVYTFTGHSLGGALATLAAIDAATAGIIPISQTSPQLYTYGSPRVGNWVFAEAVSKLIPVMFRIVHFNDIVPHVPLCQGEPITKCLNNNYGAAPIWGWHVKQEIFYNADSSSYKVCSETNTEDWSCSDSLSSLTWEAHYYYLNHFMLAC